MALPKLDGAFVVPTGGYDIGLNDADGIAAVTIAAGTYYWRSGTTTLLAALKTALDRGGGSCTYTITLDDATDTATGRLTIAGSTGSPVLTWIDTDLRDWLGFTGSSTTLTPSSTKTGANHVKGLWLPNTAWEPGEAVPTSLASGHKLGHPVRFHSFSLAPSGAGRSVVGATRYEWAPTWRPVLGRKVWANVATYVNEDWETFIADVLSGPIYAHPDRSDNTNKWQMRLADVSRVKAHNLAPPNAGANSLWALSTSFVEAL